MNSYYVYTHADPRDSLVFYVGMGREERAWRLKGRNARHRARINLVLAAGFKWGSWVRVVSFSLSRAEARTTEAALIRQHAPLGNLVNTTGVPHRHRSAAKSPPSPQRFSTKGTHVEP
jgi:hypothetical protein